MNEILKAVKTRFPHCVLEFVLVSESRPLISVLVIIWSRNAGCAIDGFGVPKQCNIKGRPSAIVPTWALCGTTCTHRLLPAIKAHVHVAFSVEIRTAKKKKYEILSLPVQNPPEHGAGVTISASRRSLYYGLFSSCLSILSIFSLSFVFLSYFFSCLVFDELLPLISFFFLYSSYFAIFIYLLYTFCLPSFSRSLFIFLFLRNKLRLL